ncbi:MAG: DUF4147 domain-containing protein [Gemmataceae bacterium]
MAPRDLRRDSEAIWRAGVDAVRAGPLVRQALARPDLAGALAKAPRILVLGAGKAGAAMAAAVEAVLADRLDRVAGWINVPEGTHVPTRRVHLHTARPAGSNHPTEEGVRGANEIMRLAQTASPETIALCLFSGGGSALLPAPAPGVTLGDKQETTRQLHACGATIQEMNAVRKHLSDIKGGRLAEAFRGERMFSLIISDVIGDPLDVIASGPTAADPTTYADALAVLERHGLRATAAAAVVRRLERGAGGELAETPKTLPDTVHNIIIGNNHTAYAAAVHKAAALGYEVRSFGEDITGEAAEAGRQAARLLRLAKTEGAPTLCFVGGGETTVTLPPGHGKGGRNQEWTLAALCALGPDGMRDVSLLSGGTDGEDGPTDAAGAIADAGTWRRAAEHGLDPSRYLARHDAYSFFQATGDLLITGLTNTNVMDLQVALIDRKSSPLP